ncbi:hypothetical protein CC79DRAFT_194907 [Sarocladium strictum]
MRPNKLKSSIHFTWQPGPCSLIYQRVPTPITDTACCPCSARHQALCLRLIFIDSPTLDPEKSKDTPVCANRADRLKELPQEQALRLMCVAIRIGTRDTIHDSDLPRIENELGSYSSSFTNTSTHDDGSLGEGDASTNQTDIYRESCIAFEDDTIPP